MQQQPAALTPVLYLDDAEDNLTMFKVAFRKRYRIFTALTIPDAIEILESQAIKVIITDQRMPEMTGVEFLRMIVKTHPYPTRIILTGYSDVEAIVAAINEVGVYRYITKPWTEKEITLTIDRAAELHDLHNENRDLMQHLSEYNQRLEQTVAERTQALYLANAELQQANREIYRLNAMLTEENESLQIQALQEREEALRALYLAQQAELKMLRYQINPHFLFNALNSIGALVKGEPAKAKEIITKFSEYLRYTVYPSSFELTTVSEELRIVQHYLDIEKVRFEEKLEIEYHVSSDAVHERIPAFILQPLAENAVKYGMKTTALPLRIRISVYYENKNFYLQVWNSGRLLLPTESLYGDLLIIQEISEETEEQVRVGGIGLKNVQERLKFIYGDHYSCELHEQDGGVRALICIYRPAYRSG